MLPDDPNYLPDFEPIALDMGNLKLDLAPFDETQRSTLSPHNSQSTRVSIGSQHEIGGLVIPQSASSFLAGPAGDAGGFNFRGGSSAGGRADVRGLDDDLGFMVDDDGNLVISDEPMRQPALPSVRGARTELGSTGSGARQEQLGDLSEGNLVSAIYNLHGEPC